MYHPTTADDCQISASVLPTGTLFPQFKIPTAPLLRYKKTAALSIAVHRPVHVGDLHVVMPVVTLRHGVPVVALRRPNSAVAHSHSIPVAALQYLQ